MKYAAQTEVEASHRTPITITLEDYEKNWRPKGWRIIFIGPTSTWRQDWGDWEAIRDIVQNCLDETDSYRYGFDEKGLWISDTGKGVSVADFLLGPPKLKPDWARGKFGEGMKIASLALLREGHSVHVDTVGKEIWVVFTEQPVNGRVKTLAAMWRPDGTRAGTRFQVVGYRGSAYPHRFTVNLPKHAILFRAASDVSQPKQRYNELIRSDMIKREPGEEAFDTGYMYCRDIYFRTIKSPFSYNLWGFKLAPDRHGPEREADMWQDAGRLWAMCDKVPLLVEFLRIMASPPQREADETHKLDFGWLGTDPITGKRRADILRGNRLAWLEAWARAFGGRNIVLETDKNLRNMVDHLGYQTIAMQWGVKALLGEVLRTDSDLVREMGEKLSKTEVISDNLLTPRELRHLALARAIAKSFDKTGPVYAANIPSASDMVARTAGTYEFGTAIIKIDRKELQYASNTVGVMDHELGHHIAYMRTSSMEQAEDLTRTHADAVEYVTGMIVKDLSQGKYDEWLRDVIW